MPIVTNKPLGGITQCGDWAFGDGFSSHRARRVLVFHVVPRPLGIGFPLLDYWTTQFQPVRDQEYLQC